MATYPEKPTRISGYTEKWISSYLEKEATASQLRKYIKAIDGKEKKDIKSIFYEMFIAEKPKKGKTNFEDGLKAMLKQKSVAEKLAKEEAKEE